MEERPLGKGKVGASRRFAWEQGGENRKQMSILFKLLLPGCTAAHTKQVRLQTKEPGMCDNGHQHLQDTTLTVMDWDTPGHPPTATDLPWAL